MNLIELMVIVSILGILATIAIPNFSKFRANAKKKEGLALGAGYYKAAKAFYAEYSNYAGNFVGTGYQPQGLLSFRLRVGTSTFTAVGVPNDFTCYRSAQPCNCGGGCPEFKTWSEKTVYPDGNPGDGVGYVHGIGGVTGCAMNGGTVLSTRKAFAIGVSGWVDSDATRPFRYMINHNKQIEICHNGFD